MKLIKRYDRNHLAKVQGYKEIFERCRFKRGYFIEDTFGQSMVSCLKNSSCQEDFIHRHKKYGTFIYDPEKSIYLRHMNGRRLIEHLYFKEVFKSDEYDLENENAKKTFS